MPVIHNTTGVSTNQQVSSAPVSGSGKFQTRKVSVGASPAGSVAAGVNFEATPSHNPVKARQIAREASRELVYDLSGAGTGRGVEKLQRYLVNHLESGKIPHELKEDFETAVLYADRVDRDIADAVSVIDKLNASGSASLSKDEQTKAQMLLGSNKYNLALIQNWLSEKAEQLAADGQLSHETETLIRSLQERFSDRHMDLADLISMYDLEEMPPESVSRSDRIGAHLLQADAALVAARQLSVPGLTEGSKAKIVEALEEHRSTLMEAKTISDSHGQSASSANGELTLAEKEVWGAFPMVSGKKGKKSHIKELQAHWDSKMQNGSADKWLPLTHDKVGQSRMLQEFIRHQLLAAGVAKKDVPDLKFMFKRADTQVLNQQQWQPINMHVRYNATPLNHSQAAERVVESQITPAKAFEKHFAHDYPSNGISCGDRLQYQHAPNLAHTQLKDESGQVLFSGLRHGVLDAYDLTAKNLQKLPDETLRPMIKDLLLSDGAAISPGTTSPHSTTATGTLAEPLIDPSLTNDAAVDEVIASIRNDPAAAADYAKLMRTEASKNMAQEVAVAALAADPDKLQSALNGETVTLNLSSISLLTPDNLRAAIKGSSSNEKVMLQRQTAALRGLAQSKPAELTLRDADGQTRTVRVNINVRTFNFGVNGGAIGKIMGVPSQTPVWKNLMGWGFAMSVNDPALTELLGPSGSAGISGNVRSKLNELEEQKEHLRSELAQSVNMPPEERTAIQEKLVQVDKHIRSINDAATQIKAMWRDGAFITGGKEPYKMVSRLALLTHMMGETPLFNCKSGKDRTGQLDAEAKCLATFAENNGHLPPLEAEVPGLRQMRSQFTLGTGNLEMQRMNTGLPGYKLKWSEVPGLANMVAEEGLEAAYRGGSDHISS